MVPGSDDLWLALCCSLGCRMAVKEKVSILLAILFGISRESGQIKAQPLVVNSDGSFLTEKGRIGTGSGLERKGSHPNLTAMFRDGKMNRWKGN